MKMSKILYCDHWILLFNPFCFLTFFYTRVQTQCNFSILGRREVHISSSHSWDTHYQFSIKILLSDISRIYLENTYSVNVYVFRNHIKHDTRGCSVWHSILQRKPRVQWKELTIGGGSLIHTKCISWFFMSVNLSWNFWRQSECQDGNLVDNFSHESDVTSLQDPSRHVPKRLLRILSRTQ